jgi:hypothetical protein
MEWISPQTRKCNREDQLIRKDQFSQQMLRCAQDDSAGTALEAGVSLTMREFAGLLVADWEVRATAGLEAAATVGSKWAADCQGASFVWGRAADFLGEEGLGL